LATCHGEQILEAQYQDLQKVLDKYQHVEGSLIPLLQEAQEIFGYLPEDVMKKISAKVKVPFSKTYGVATFYSQFHLQPRGRHVIRVCQGTACHVRGGTEILAAAAENLGVAENGTTEDLRYTLETVACLGACGQGPVLMVNNETHGRVTAKDVPKILGKYE
jgi:NADH-quinone oxidoreductase subunit E